MTYIRTYPTQQQTERVSEKRGQRTGVPPTSAGLLVTGTSGVTLIHNMAVFLMLRRRVRLHKETQQQKQQEEKKGNKTDSDSLLQRALWW